MNKENKTTKWQMSFFDGTLDKKKLVKLIEESDDIRYTYGLAYRRPVTYRKPISKKEALKIVSEEGFLDADNNEGYLHINAFSGNDLF